MSVHLGKLTLALTFTGLSALATLSRASAAPAAKADALATRDPAAPAAVPLAGGEHHGPPQEAIDACTDLDEGDACEVTTPDGKTLDGVCAATRDGQVACRPNHPPAHGKPPQAAIDACSSAASGDACVMSIQGHDVNGTCEEAPSGGLACRPEGPPPEGRAS